MGWCLNVDGAVIGEWDRVPTDRVCEEDGKGRTEGLGTARLLVSALQFEARLAWIVSFGDAVQDCTNRFVSVIVGPSR